MRSVTLTLLLIAGLGLATSTHAQRLSPEAAADQGTDLTALAQDTATPASPRGGVNACTEDVLLIVDSSIDGVALFDPMTGDLIDPAFISDPDHLSTPRSAIPNFDGDGIFVSDQLDDAVWEYDCDGNFVGLFAPAGGVDNNILDNARGMAISPDGTKLWVTNGGGPNEDTVAEFDTAGNYLGNLFPNGDNGLVSPFDVFVRDSDVLVSDFLGDPIFRYDFSGNFLGFFALGDDVLGHDAPMQLNGTSGGNVLVAGFSSPSGVYEYDASGTEVGYYGVNGTAQGVYELPNGNLLTTNGSGTAEITRSNTLVRLVSSAGTQYIERFPAVGGGCDLGLNSVTVSPDPVAPGSTLNIMVDVSNSGAPQAASLMMTYSGPVSGMLNLGGATVPTTASLQRTLRLRVPNAAPAGAYSLEFQFKDASGNICDTETVSASVAAPRVGQTGTVAFELADGSFSAAAVTTETTVAPNPLTTAAQIAFSTEATADVRLAVYDVLGREVAVLVDGTLEAGAHSATFDASDLAAGTYVYRLVIGSEVQTGRMTIVR